MAWRLARSLETLRTQINFKWPRRDRKSDGTIGDTRHQAKKSDHNPRSGVVTAFDITKDTKNGPDLHALRRELIKDARTKYIIYEGKLYKPDGSIQKNSGHTNHLHLSVNWENKDQSHNWNLPLTSTEKLGVKPAIPVAAGGAGAAETPSSTRQVLKKGMTGGDVPVLQLLLNHYKAKITVDGDFGAQTEKALKAFQASRKLVEDGICGPLSWTALGPYPPVAPPVAVSEEIVNYTPQMAIEYYEGLGWSRIQSIALVANLIWESGGNHINPAKYTIKFSAHGDKDKEGVYRSHGAGQWNEKAGRYDALLNYAMGMSKPWDDPRTQLGFLNRELQTTEKRAAAKLRSAVTIEDAVEAAIGIWRPSIPHADKRLAIAKKLMV